MNDSSTVMNGLISVVKQVTCRQPERMTYSDLYDYLSRHYDAKSRKGVSLYEYFQSSANIKPHFDYEELLMERKDIYEFAIRQKFLEVANELFKTTDADWAISNDSRPVVTKIDIDGTETKVQRYKISFHFVLWTRYCNFDAFGQWVKSHVSKFEDEELNGIDLKIYRHGINKFRLPMTKKNPKKITSCLKPLNYKDKPDFHKHIVSYVEGAEEWKVPESCAVEMAYKHCANTKQNVIEDKIAASNLNATQEIESIIGTYTIIGNKKKGYNEFSDCIFYDIKEQECGLSHNSNHNYLVHNTVHNTLKVKCHSQRCVLFQKTLYNEAPTTLHFELDYIRNIPIPTDATDNYKQIKKYFEQFFIFIRDSNSYYRIAYEYSEKYKYFEKLLKPISIQGFQKDLFYQQIVANNNDDANPDEEDEKPQNNIENRNFFKHYDRDQFKTSYLGLSFQPYGIHTNCQKINNGDYNLFGGFDYTRQLTYLQKHNLPNEPEHQESFEFLLNHIRYYICGLSKAKEERNQNKIALAQKSFTYLMSYLANIIQSPTIVPQIILIFYSKTHGTGKSGFTKFLSAIIGQGLVYFGSYEQIMEKHSQAHVGKLLNIIEEVDKRTSQKYHNRMKDFSQRERAVYNEKNKPQYDIKTYVRYIKTTNYRDGVWFDNEDRRYVLYTFDRIDNIEYVNKWLSVLKDPYVIYLFGKYLSEFRIPYDFSDWERERPLTDDYYDMRCEDPITQFLTDFVQLQSISVEHLNRTAFFPIEGTKYLRLAIAKEEFYNLFTKFYDDNNCMNRNYKNKRKFVNHLKNNYVSEISVKKFKVSRRDYYDINLGRLSQRLLESEYDITTHFGDQESGSDIA